MNTWYVIFCKARQEFVAKENLERQGYLVLLPLIAKQQRRRGRWVDTIEPLFPRYLFAATVSDQQSLSPIRSTLGVSRLVRFGVQPATVPEAIIEELRAMRDEQTGACGRVGAFKAGDLVHFEGGPMAGLEGVFEMEAGEDRVYVLLDLLGKANKVKVNRDWLVPAD